MSTAPKGRVLAVAGSDPSGGAGIQADIKTVTALGGYAAAVITALTVQNSKGVTDVLPVPAVFVADQMKAVLTDIGADCVKTGMLYDTATIEHVADVLVENHHAALLVIDPVMIATSGDTLMQSGAIEMIKDRLFPLANLVTPNTIEASLLTGMEITEVTHMLQAAEILLAAGAEAVLLKGGHLPGNKLADILVPSVGDAVIIESHRISTQHTHGTGCTMASAIAALLAQGHPLEEAFRHAHAYVRRAIELAPGFGGGHGPLGHAAATPYFYQED